MNVFRRQMSSLPHVSVLRETVCSELSSALKDQKSRKIVLVDGTLGAGGHSLALMKELPNVAVIGIDKDVTALELAGERLTKEGVEIERMHGDFCDLKNILKKSKTMAAMERTTVDGILLDLGVSSMQLDQAERGFSFRKDGPLDMRMDVNHNQLTAKELINTFPIDVIGEIIQRYGEEKNWRKITERIAIVRRQESIDTTMDLIRALAPVLDWKRKGVHPATRTFQAIRIAVNNELKSLSNFLAEAPDLIHSSGVLGIISFHSLEDRLVKDAFSKSPVLKPLRSKPLGPSDKEIDENPRSRSAKFRVAVRV